MRALPRCQILTPEGETLHVLGMGGALRVGRAPTNDLVFDDPSVSRHHARVLWEAGSACPVLHHSGSANGVRVDGARVFNSAPLRDGALLELGRVELRIKLLGLEGLPERRAAEGAPPWITPESVIAPAVLSGLLSGDRPLRLVLRWFEARQATGTLRVTSPGGEISVALHLGQVLRLESPWGEDRGALQRSLSASSGSYGLLPFVKEYEGSAPPLNVWVGDLLDGKEGDETERLNSER